MQLVISWSNTNPDGITHIFPPSLLNLPSFDGTHLLQTFPPHVSGPMNQFFSPDSSIDTFPPNLAGDSAGTSKTYVGPTSGNTFPNLLSN